MCHKYILVWVVSETFSLAPSAEMTAWGYHHRKEHCTWLGERTLYFYVVIGVVFLFLTSTRWVQGIPDEAASELLPQHLCNPPLMAARWHVSTALWAAGEQHEESVQEGSESCVQALQSEQEVSKAAPNQLTTWKVSTTALLSSHCGSEELANS